MKLFDYKLILLIALTFVIYFMYRELQSLNQRIEKVEKNVEELPQKQLQHNPEPQFINFKQPSNMNNMMNHVEENNIHVSSPKIKNSIAHTLETNTLETNTLETNTLETIKDNLNEILPNDSCSISTEDEDSEELHQMNQNNMLEAEDAVEIYSNDNIEEVSSQKTSEIDEDDIVIKETVEIGQHVINQVINAINDGDDEYMTSSISIENIISEEQLYNESPELVEEDNMITSPNNNLEEIKAEQHISDDNDEPKIEINVDNLVKQKKLKELKDMAKQLNIELKHNGKARTKKELALEIFNVQNNQ